MDASENDRYRYYFSSDRPAFVDRLIDRKHAVLFRLVRAQTARRVLEIGPGEGRFVELVRQVPGAHVETVEASPEGARRLRDAGVETHQAAVPPIPDRLGSYDLIYASHLVEHMGSADEVRDLLGQAAQHLRPDGVIALVFPDARAMGFEFWDADYTHQWPSTERRISQVAVDAGLEVVMVRRVCLTAVDRAARLLSTLVRLYPYALLASLLPGRKEFLYRGKLLFSLDVVVILRPLARPT